jgi:ATP-dependent Clp protease ATP-binding subunit ClpA
MAVWQENLKAILSQKEVLILHGNIRDTAYIKKNGDLIRGFTELIRNIGTELGYQRGVFWGVFFDSEGQGHPPIWSLERIEYFDGTGKSEIRDIGAQDREFVLLNRWLERDVRDTTQKTIFVINYIDKLTPYSPRGIYSKDEALLITMIQKIIENMAENNRLIMVALQDTLIPLEYYTNSPKVAVMEIPLPDLDERKIYFSRYLAPRNLLPDQIDFISNITDGLYFRDLDNILKSILEEHERTPELSYERLRRIVNRYRIGSEEDPWLRLPLTDPPKGLIDSAEEWFKKRVIGQDHAVEQVVKAIKKARAGVAGLASGQASKPKAVFFFAGPTGVGKTFLAKKLAEYLFDSEEAFIRLDMSEFKEEHTVSKLIGSPPGYVGYEKGGQLTNAVKSRPFSVILFDEIEKAHPKIMDIFLQILDDGRLTDSRGQTVFFTESVIIFTSNIGTRTTDSRGQHISEREELERILANEKDPQKDEKIREHFIRAVREFFMYEISRPELLNRIGSQIIAFNYLNKDDVKRRIIQSKLEDISSNFRDRFSHLGHRLRFSPKVADYFLEKHGDSIERFGGRGLVNAIDDEIGHLIADQILYAEKNRLTDVTFVIDLNEGGELRCYRES